ncbi:MAG: radical SAM protein [Proteobacteria bacterium]|nr:radical SAM protein [Pseudomonadota bacterium]NIS60170.1 radical SAM protein [Pseudomonadota bacterium]
MNSRTGESINQSVGEESLGIEVTTHCNSTCAHCFARAGIPERSSLPVDLVMKIIAEGYNMGYRRVHLTGGEPLLWEGLFETLDHAFDLGYEAVSLNTNGTVLMNDVVDRLAYYDCLSISVSLQGPEELHDLVRGEGSYEQTLKGIEKIHDAGISCVIFATACKSLLPDLPQFASDIYERFPHTKGLTLIQLIRVTNDIFDLSKDLLTPNDFLQLVRMVSLLNLCGMKTYVLNNPLACVASRLLKMPWIPLSHPLYRAGSLFVMANRDITLAHSSRDRFGKYRPGMIEKVLSSCEYRNAIAPDGSICPKCTYQKQCRENGMIRPSEWFRDMHPEVPYCKRVLDRAAAEIAQPSVQ